jgi:GxxExxY protein
MEYTDINDITKAIITCAMEVHIRMGPGLFEAIYEECLMHELEYYGVKAERQVAVDLYYRDQPLKSNYMIDLLVEDKVIVELKAVKEIHPIHTAQVLSYLRLANKPVGLLINFHNPVLKDGIKRYVRNL